MNFSVLWNGNILQYVIQYHFKQSLLLFHLSMREIFPKSLWIPAFPGKTRILQTPHCAVAQNIKLIYDKFHHTLYQPQCQDYHLNQTPLP